MSLLQIAAPDLTSLAYGGATLQLLEGLGFSQDRATLLVRATFTDDADGGGTPHYAMWTYDLVQRQYTACLNALLTPAGGYPADTEVTSALIVGAGSQQTVVVESALRGTVSGSSLSLLTAGVVTDANVLFSVLGPDIALRIERYSLSQDGRFLALQTDSNLLAPDAAPDGNDVSDIYLLDLLTHQTQRVSFVANTEVYAPVQLGNIYSDGAQVQVAFSSAAAFVTADKNSTALTTEAQTDAYVWRSSFDAAGLTGAPTFQLVSARTDGTAAGFVGGDVDVLATASGVYFSSASAELVANDNNAAMDVFSVSNGGLVERVAISGFDELANGAGLVSASSDGRVLGLLTSSEEVAGPDNLQQLLVIDTQSAIWRVASSVSATVLANDIVLNGVLTPDGRSIAFTSSADNLVSGLPPALAGSLYVTLTEVIPNNLPTGSVTIGGTATATQGQTLTAANTLADLDGLGAISYQWLANNSAISGATSSTFTLLQAQVGKTIAVTASYTDGFGVSESVSSAGTSVVANVNDSPTGTVTITGTATQGQTLTAANSLADLDGLGQISYQWKADGVSISGATADAYTPSQAEVGKVITVVASYTDGFNKGESVTSSATVAVVNVDDVATGTLAVTGTAAEGGSLVASLTAVSDADGATTTAYAWQKNISGTWTDISGATAATLTIPSDQSYVGKNVRVIASTTDDQGGTTAFTSDGQAIANVNDAPSGSVTISGTATQGQTLSAANALADLDGLGEISYQWLENGSAISGANVNTLTLRQAEVGKVITVVASYTDGFSQVESVASSATDSVANINDAPTGAVTISGIALQGQTLLATNTLDDADGLGELAYQWLANGVPIANATGSSWLVDQPLDGQPITVAISYVDGLGTAESVTSQAAQAGKTVDILAYSWKAHTLLEGVALTSTGYNDITDTSGAASFTGVIDASLSLAATRPIPTAEAATTASAVNLQDAIAILKMIVGLDVNGAGKPLSPYQTLAADFDGNGAVGLTDAIGVLKHVVGLPADNPEWKFVKETEANPTAQSDINADLSGTSPVHVGLVGYLSGDVDGSFAGAAGASSLDSSYFTTLIEVHPELNLSQFGIYNTVPV